jgi:hypothetical protein
MVDIETIGLDRDAAIVEIGAVRFSADGVGDETFYRSINPTSCQRAGLTIDADTLEWWLSEQPQLAANVLPGGDALGDVLVAFVAWWRRINADEIWANSPAFDCESLEFAGAQVGVTMPWEFYQERDLRTLDSLPHDVDREQEGTEHSALDDALYQARVASSILGELRGTQKE